MTEMTLKERETTWKSQVKVMADGGYYKSQKAANVFFNERLARAWREVMRFQDDDAILEDTLGLTPTMLLMLHLFCKAYQPNRRVIVPKAKAPVFECWPPAPDGRTFHAVPKRDIAKIIGKSVSSVENALTRFRGKGCPEADLIKVWSLAVPIAIPSGIMLDCKLSPQACFTFMYEDYAVGKTYAQRAAIQQCETYDMQAAHCEAGYKATRGLRIVPAQARTEGAA